VPGLGARRELPVVRTRGVERRLELRAERGLEPLNLAFVPLGLRAHRVGLQRRAGVGPILITCVIIIIIIIFCVCDCVIG
jgi:hypothetical protein